MTIRKPVPYTASSPLGVIVPSSAPSDMARLSAGLRALEARGVAVEYSESAIEARGYLGAPDHMRAQTINTFIRRTDVAALCAIRGGYGALRILDALDYDSARHHSKLLIGYSDITALHFAFFTQAGWTGIQGPMIAVEWADMDPDCESQFWRLAGGGIDDPLLGPSGEPLNPLRPGTSEGRLLGGNLASIVRLIGTPYLPRLDGTILYFEETGEAPYRIDALLAQLKLAGILDALGGVVLGAFTECDPLPGKPSFTTQEVLQYYFGDAPYPVADGLVFGHIPVKTSMPFGIQARLSVTDTDATLSMLESVTERA